MHCVYVRVRERESEDLLGAVLNEVGGELSQLVASAWWAMGWKWGGDD